MLLIELYDYFTTRKEREKNSVNELTQDNLKFLIEYENGKFLNLDCCQLELYFMILYNEIELANFLLNQPFLASLREDLENSFPEMDYDNFNQIIENDDYTRKCIKLSLIRQLDGIAL
jgi:hypothetical protein